MLPETFESRERIGASACGRTPRPGRFSPIMPGWARPFAGAGGPRDRNNRNTNQRPQRSRWTARLSHLSTARRDSGRGNGESVAVLLQNNRAPFDKLTMREVEDCRVYSAAFAISVTAPTSLMVSLSNHAPQPPSRGYENGNPWVAVFDQCTRMLRNCQGSLVSMSSLKKPGRFSSGVQSV